MPLCLPPQEGNTPLILAGINDKRPTLRDQHVPVSAKERSSVEEDACKNKVFGKSSEVVG